MGAYNSPATPPEQVVKALSEVMDIEGDAHLVIGDLNARSRMWDSDKKKLEMQLSHGREGDD